MKKKICMILIAVFVAVLGTSTYFIIDHHKESNISKPALSLNMRDVSTASSGSKTVDNGLLALPSLFPE